MKIILKRPQCISCGSCAAVCPDYFKMAEDNLSHLKNSAKEGENEILELDEDKLGCARDAVDVCPVQIIEIQ